VQTVRQSTTMTTMTPMRIPETESAIEARPSFAREEFVSGMLIATTTHKCVEVTSHITTFRASRRRREMYTGHARLSVCLPVCLAPPSQTTARTLM